MQDVEKNVPIDTSGNEVDVDIEETKDEAVVEQKEETVENPNVREVVKEETKPVETKEEPKEEVKSEEPKAEEEKPKDELGEYSDSIKKRIAKLTKKWREAERQKDAAITYAQKVEANRKVVETKLGKLEPGFLDATEKSITAGLDAAKAKLARAREASDVNAEADAMAEISEVGVRKAQWLEAKAKAEEQAKAKPQARPTLDQALQPKQPVQDPRAEEWASRNEWFGKDNAMTYTAFDLHKKLTEDEGFDPNSNEYYAEIDKRIRLEFPNKFGTTEVKPTAKPTQIVAEAKRSVRPGRKTVRLTPSQQTIAKKLGVPLEEYARQLSQITKEV